MKPEQNQATTAYETADFNRASRIAGIEISEIVRFSEAASAMRAAGRDVLSIGAGAPDYPTPEHVIAAAHQAALAGETRYPPTKGTAKLRKAIAGDPLLDCRSPEGAFYVFASCPSALGRQTPSGELIGDDTGFCRHVLETQELALLPGRAFSVPGYFRLSHAASEAELNDGLARLSRTISALTPAPALRRNSRD